MTTKEYILQLAHMLAKTKTTMTGSTLAQHLNQHHFRTSYGTNYQGGRGTYKLIHTTYNSLEAAGKQKDADTVAAAFTKANGEYAYH